LLSNPKMKAHYGRVTWLFVSRNFKDDEKDREAARTHDRFGISSWPQLVLFDPRDDAVLAFMPRGFDAWVQALAPLADKVPKPTAATTEAVATFRAAQKLAGEEPAAALAPLDELATRRDDAGAWLAARELLRKLRADERSLADRLADPDVRERALAVEAIADLGAAGAPQWAEAIAARLLDDRENIVVRIRALNQVAQHRPELVAERAAELLLVPSDAFRYRVLEVVATHPDPSLAPLLARLFAGAGTTVPSRNPNVLRGHLSKCLGSSGDAAAIDAVAPLIREANARNGTTRTTIAALGELSGRVADADRRRIVALLLEGMPPALATDAEQVDVRLVAARVKELLAALAVASQRSLPTAPGSWSEQARTQFLSALRKAID